MNQSRLYNISIEDETFPTNKQYQSRLNNIKIPNIVYINLVGYKKWAPNASTQLSSTAVKQIEEFLAFVVKNLLGIKSGV